MISLVIEKLFVVQNGIRATIEQEIPDCKLTIYEAVEQLEQYSEVQGPDLILISLLSYVGGQATSLVSRAQALFPKASIVVYGSHPESDGMSLYYRAGAKGYCSLEGYDLVNCMKMVISGKTYFSSSMVDYFITKLQSQRNIISRDALTSREYQIACYFAKGMNTSLIAKELKLAVSTVSTFKMQIFRKLGITSIVELPAKLSRAK